MEITETPRECWKIRIHLKGGGVLYLQSQTLPVLFANDDSAEVIKVDYDPWPGTGAWINWKDVISVAWWKSDVTSKPSAITARQERNASLCMAIEAVGGLGSTIAAVAEHMGTCEKTIRRWVTKSRKWEVLEGRIELRGQKKKEVLDL